MIWMYEHSVGVERTKVKRMEMEALVNAVFDSKNQLLSKKYEDSTLQGGDSKNQLLSKKYEDSTLQVGISSLVSENEKEGTSYEVPFYLFVYFILFNLFYFIYLFVYFYFLLL